MNRIEQKFWTADEENLLREVVLSQSLTYKQIYEKYFPYRSHYSVQGKCQKLNLDSSATSRKYFYNDKYFSQYTLDSCYYAGYFMADGCIYLSNNSKIFSWSVADKDLGAMRLFLDKVGFEGKIQTYIKKCSIAKRNKDKIFKHHKISIVNCRWINDLENKFGVTMEKTYRNVPQNFPSEDMELAFLLGLLDGDGCITRMKKDNSNFCIGMASCSLPTVEWFQRFVIRLNLPSLAWKDNKIIFREGCYYYTVRGVEAAFLFEKLKQVNVQKLDRKWNNPDILECVEKCKKRYYNSTKKDPKKSKIQQINFSESQTDILQS